MFGLSPELITKIGHCKEIQVLESIHPRIFLAVANLPLVVNSADKPHIILFHVLLHL